MDASLGSALAAVAGGAERLAVVEIGELARGWVLVGLVHPVNARRPLPADAAQLPLDVRVRGTGARASHLAKVWKGGQLRPRFFERDRG